MKEENFSESSQDALEKLKQTKIELYSKQSLEELLSPDTKNYISESDIDIQTVSGLVKAKKIELGCYFSYVKMKAGHGKFEETIKREYPNISIRTIQRYMKSFLHGDRTIERIVNSKKSKQIREKKARGESLTQAEERNYKLQNTLYEIKKTLKLIIIHGVEETLENYIPEEKKESLVKDIVVITETETERLEKQLEKDIKTRDSLREKINSKEKSIKKIKREIQEKRQLQLELKPKM